MRSTNCAAHHSSVGNLNCGKTALSKLLTGARQKVANYAGVTVERKVGVLCLSSGRSMSVVDATNLRMNSRLVLELTRLGKPMVVTLNMADVARSHGLIIDTARLAAELGCPVVETVAVKSNGHAQLLSQLEQPEQALFASRTAAMPVSAAAQSPTDLQREVRRILAMVAPTLPVQKRFQYRLDAVVMHPVWGLAILAAVLFLIFQAVFSWANVPMDAIKTAIDTVAD